MGYQVQIWRVCLFIIDVSRNLIWRDAHINICSQSVQVKLPDLQKGNLRGVGS